MYMYTIVVSLCLHQMCCTCPSSSFAIPEARILYMYMYVVTQCVPAMNCAFLLGAF